MTWSEKEEGNFGSFTSISSQNARTELPRSLLHKRVDTVANMGRVRTKTVKKGACPAVGRNVPSGRRPASGFRRLGRNNTGASRKTLASMPQISL